MVRQYSGKRANCQAQVSLTRARAVALIPPALRLSLLEEWTSDAARAAAKPGGRIKARSKGQIALKELDRLFSVGVEFVWAGLKPLWMLYACSCAWRRADPAQPSAVVIDNRTLQSSVESSPRRLRRTQEEEGLEAAHSCRYSGESAHLAGDADQ